MNNSIRRIRALIKKELKDFTKNANVTIICFLPLLFVILFSSMNSEIGMRSIDILNMGFTMNATLVGAFAVSMLIAEEKEKNTLRTLMLSSVKPLEFLLSKAIVVLIFTTITNLVMYLILGIDIAFIGHFIIWSTVVTIIMIILGGIIGMVSKSQMATGVVGMPILVLFFIPSMLAPANNIIKSIASIIPIYNFQILMQNIFNGLTYLNSYNFILNIMIWVIVSTLGFIFVFNKKGLDK